MKGNSEDTVEAILLINRIILEILDSPDFDRGDHDGYWTLNGAREWLRRDLPYYKYINESS